jgi:hypothetical protein
MIFYLWKFNDSSLLLFLLLLLLLCSLPLVTFRRVNYVVTIIINYLFLSDCTIDPLVGKISAGIHSDRHVAT